MDKCDKKINALLHILNVAVRTCTRPAQGQLTFLYTTITVVFPVTVLWVIVEGEHFSELGCYDYRGSNFVVAVLCGSFVDHAI